MSRFSLLLLAVCCLALSALTVDAKVSRSTIPHHKQAHSHHAKVSQHKNSRDTSSPPLWPEAFNATLIKIGSESLPNDFIFGKLYFTTESSRFDFYTSYQGEDQQWIVNSTLLMTPVEYEGTVYPMMYVIQPFGGPNGGPEARSFHSSPRDSANATCYIFSTTLGNIQRNWLQNFVYQTSQLIRGVYVQWWQDSLDSSRNYYNRPDTYSTPVRSTSPSGISDYVDFIVGDQDDSLFDVPAECPPPSSHFAQSAYGLDHDLINMLPSPFSEHIRSHLNKKYHA